MISVMLSNLFAYNLYCTWVLYWISYIEWCPQFNTVANMMLWKCGQRLVQVRGASSSSSSKAHPPAPAAKETTATDGGGRTSTRARNATRAGAGAGAGARRRAVERGRRVARDRDSSALQLIGALLEWLVHLQFGTDASRCERREPAARTFERSVKVSSCTST